jgi:hypothetical protein
MTRTILLAAALAALSPAAFAQTPDFGDDSSAWANDGECDDPRFQGPGMTTTVLLDEDRGRDATDCRNAFTAGTITLAGNAEPAATDGGKTPAPAVSTVAGGLLFGDDSGRYPRDGECDDRRFVGQGMAVILSWTETGRDATDCQALYNAGSIRLWVMAEALSATQCAAIDFGNDSGEFPNDGECDDMRFEGPGSSSVIGGDFLFADATDCSQLCTFGVVALRDY